MRPTPRGRTPVARIEYGINRCHIPHHREQQMRTTVALDDELLAEAQAYTGLREKSALLREALKALVERESARRLARLGGSEPELSTPPRRKTKPA
jgi:Arc/MetJ family transcription regulator